MSKQQKPRMGRPPKGDDKRLPFTCHLSPECRKKLDAVAERTGLSRSDVVNDFLTRASVRWLTKIVDK